MTPLIYFNERTAFERFTEKLMPMRAVVEPYLTDQDSTSGYCLACNVVTTLQVVKPPAGGWINLRESIACSQCGLSGRKRQALSVVLSEVASGAFTRIHVLERITPMFSMLRAKGLPVEGSEYIGAACAPGSLHKVREIEVRHEDVHNLSYADGELDMICHFDVLEHVADYRRALSECARVLRPGGVMIFTVPFFGGAQHQIRAELKDGEIIHHSPPAYHGNPMSASGSLVYFIPGWPLLANLRDVGFSRAEIGLSYDPFQGIVSDNNPHPGWLMWPVVFRAIRA